MRIKLIGVVLVISLTACTPANLLRPVFEYPIDGQTLDYELAYSFKVSPIEGADGYRWDFIQNGVLVWDNLRDEGSLSPSDYGLPPGSAGHARFVAGDVRVEVRARVKGIWSEPAVITIHLRPMESLPTVTHTPSASPTQTPSTTETPASIETPSSAKTPSSTKKPAPTTTALPPLPTGQPVRLASLRMLDARTGWAIESTGHILRTQDGGGAWKDITPPQGQYKSGGFFALDAMHAWAIPYQTGCYTDGCPPAPTSVTIWRTADGGTSWQSGPPLCLGGDCGYDFDVSPSYLDTIALQFLDANTGWMLVTVEHVMFQDRYRVYQTTDGGNTWKMVSDSGGGSPMAFMVTGLAFQDAQTGWMGVSQVGGAMSPSADWSALKTNDAGKTWEDFPLPAPSDLPEDFAQKDPWCGVNEIHVLPPRTVDLAMDCYYYNPSTAEDQPSVGFRYHSADAGETWSVWQQIGSVQFINPAVGWQLYSPGSNTLGQLQKTTDAGKTWTTIQKVAWPNVQLDFVDEQIGWAIVTGPESGYALVHTTDGGKTWGDLKPKIGP